MPVMYGHTPDIIVRQLSCLVGIPILDDACDQPVTLCLVRCITTDLGCRVSCLRGINIPCCHVLLVLCFKTFVQHVELHQLVQRSIFVPKLPSLSTLVVLHEPTNRPFCVRGIPRHEAPHDFVGLSLIGDTPRLPPGDDDDPLI